ncbi:MAG: lipoyl synthase [Eubacteriales bacterium]
MNRGGKCAERPPWLTIKAPDPARLAEMKAMTDRLKLHTVCESAACPNQGECFARGTATFMILGDVCTRRCRFCAVAKGAPAPPDDGEPEMVAEAAVLLGLRHAVLTSVTRDDLPDGGAGHFARAIGAVRRRCPGVTIEVLIPDFQGDAEALAGVVRAGPQVINHNIETVPRLYPLVRPGAGYHRSLQLLRRVKKMDSSPATKSGLMVGLGETEEEVAAVLRDLRAQQVDLVTIGQYLRPSPEHLPVDRYITPEQFQAYKGIASSLGLAAEAGPLVRSSYHATELYEKLK